MKIMMKKYYNDTERDENRSLFIIKRTGGTPEVGSDKSLTILTFDI